MTTGRATTTKFSLKNQKKEETFATSYEKGDSATGNEKATTFRRYTGVEEVGHSLAEGTGGEHLGDEVDVPAGDVDPGGVELHYVAVLERLE